MGVCSQEMSTAGFNTGMGPTCSMDSGYSFHVITAAPTGDQIKKICASAACKTVMAAMKAAQPGECNTGGPMWDFQVYAQIFGPIDKGCSAPPPPSPPAPPPTAPPTTPPPPPPPTAPPTTAAPPPPSTTTPAPPSTTASGGASNGGTTNSGQSNGGGTSNEATATPTSGGSSAETTTSTDTQGSSAGVNSTWTLAPSSGVATDSVASSRNSTSSSNINTATNEASGNSNSTMIIAIVAGVVVVIALVAFLAFRAGRRKNKNDSPREDSYVGVASTRKSSGAVVARSNGRSGGAYVPSPLTDATTTSAGVTRSSGALTRSAGRSPAPATSSNTRSSVGSNATAAAAGGTTGLWTDRAIEKARIALEDISMGDVFSQGAFGEVLRGSYNGEAVAIKRLLPARRKDMKEIESFLEEAKLLTSLRHQRIVAFVGVAWDSLTDLCVVTEFMDGGDLRSLLTHANDNDEPTGFDANKVKIALHIVHALSYLHGLKPIVVHRDLKSKNVLLTRDLDAKLTDFGVSRERADKTMTANVGSSRWMAPEIMLGERYDEKADIFSFGVVLSELDTQKLPYADAKEPGTDRQIPEMAMLNMVSSGTLTVAFTEGADPEMVGIGRACVAVDPKERPTASEVLRRLHHIYRSYRHV